MSDLSSDAPQFISALLVFIAGGVLSLSLRSYFRVTASRAIGLYLWHSLFALVYFNFIIIYGGDATDYYRFSFSDDLVFGFGTRAVRLVTSFFSQGLGMSFLGCSLVFQIVGYIGLLAFDGALRAVTWNKSRNISRLASLIVFLPSISFWSSGLGKDSLAFCATGLALWAALNMKRRLWLMVVALLLMLLVRPHMAGILAIGLAVSFAARRGVSLSQRMMMGGLALGATAVLVPLALNYVGVGDESGFKEIMDYVEVRQGYNMRGGGAVDISNMSVPAQMFTYLFRPTLIEVRNLFFLAAAVDNIILMFVFIFGGWAMFKNVMPFHLRAHNRLFMWTYSLGAWMVLAMTTANLGIALRQKWMFAPMLIFLLISVMGHTYERRKSDLAARVVPYR